MEGSRPKCLQRLTHFITKETYVANEIAGTKLAKGAKCVYNIWRCFYVCIRWRRVTLFSKIQEHPQNVEVEIT